MSQAIHVNGPALLYTGYAMWDGTHANIAGASGNLDSPAQLGISEEGVDLSITYFDDPVIADTGGPNCPVDLQDMGVIAEIRARLVIYDLAKLTTLRQRGSGTAGTFEAEGALPPIGTLIYANGFANRLIVIDQDETAWRFWATKLRGASEIKLGTKRKIWNLRWIAWAPIGVANTAAGAVLYDHTNA
jgi:hypothetical protein